jgi:Protein of unknown function (DUF1592)/Protein of unknown function (DUF1588)/PA14 domain/Protein of unknown function (DUF1595)/Cytochrome C oxidase, cbb3-type, subunit III
MSISKQLTCLAFCLSGWLVAQETPPNGESIFARHCAKCHGDHGEGVPDECEDPLQGDRPLPALARYIDRKMPEDEPELLDADESRRVAEYIMGAFYSPEARAKNQPTPKMAFSRLTNRQFRESVADLIGSFGETRPPGEARGLKARYFQSDGMNKKAKMAFEREDACLDFDFGGKSPGDGINDEQFAIEWEGSLLAPATGWYDFRLSTPNGARVYLNGERQQGDGNQRDDSSAKRQPTFIDAWVSSGSEVREISARMFLLGGRGYPFRLDWFKFKEPRGMVRLEWKAPLGEWEVLGAPYLSPTPAAHVAVVSTPFPPDDASEGYERGCGVSKAWQEATTVAAIDAADQVVTRLPRLSGVKDDDPERLARLKKFVADFASRAFRRPLDDEQRGRYVDGVFAAGVAPEQAVKRAVILILQSPRFLYPEIGPHKDDYTVAARLALGAWDSLPDPALLDVAREGRLRTEDQVAEQARRLMADPRAKAKLAGFFEHWLKLDVESDLRKESEMFPGFDAALVADLRRSLELFVEKVVWSEGSDYRELMQADYLLLNERLAKFYGVAMPDGGGFQKVALDPAERSGVVTHPYLLARLAHHNQTSPIQRGVFVTRNLLGGILKPPPKAIEFNDGHFDPKLSMREKVVQITRNTSCMTCHETINPLGFSLENFDAVGRFRSSENEQPIISESDFETFDGGRIRLHGARDVAKHAVESVTARRGFIRQLFQAVIKQNPGVYGPETLARLETKFTGSGYHIRHLLVDIQTLAALHGITPTDSNKP